MIGPRWLFFFFLFLAVSSISFPIFILINQRIERNGVTSLLPSVRESIELAFFVGLVVWLKFGRVLEFFTAGLILFGIVAIELMIRMIERSRFSPNLPEQENNEE
jgi:hypothetical protein